MAPTAVSAPDAEVKIADLKAKIVNEHVEVEVEPKLPVADNYMYDFKYNHSLPTIDVLGQDVQGNVNAEEAARALVSQLEDVLGSGDAHGFAGLFLEYGEYSFFVCKIVD